MGHQHLVAAIDVGYGFTKFRPGFTGATRTDKFPSIVVDAEKIHLSDTTLKSLQSNSVIVCVGDNAYRRVGPSAADELANAGGQRVLNESFSSSVDYLALLRGALTYMEVTRLSLLQLGLPISTFYKAPALKKWIEGEHTLVRPNGEHYICNIKRVEIAPQPLAAYVNYRKMDAANNQGKGAKNALVVDVGFYTLDWLVTKAGTISRERSGAENGGMNKVVSIIADGMEKEIGSKLPTAYMQVIEEALGAETYTVMRFAKEYSFEKFLPKARLAIEKHIQVMVNKVGTAVDIADIVVCGGGARFFYPLLKARYPDHNVICTADSQFDIVNGLYGLAIHAAEEETA